MTGSNRGSSLPTRAQILEFVETSQGKVDKREIARAFGVGGADRAALRRLLRDMADDGLIARRARRNVASGELPPVFVAEVDVLDGDGDPVAAPVDWRGAGPPPRFALVPRGPASGHRGPASGRRGPAPGPGDRVLVRRRGADRAEIVHVIGHRASRVVGVYEPSRRGGFVRSVERRGPVGVEVAAGGESGARPGDLVVADSDGRGRARISAVFGAFDRAGAVSELVLERNAIPREFPADALSEAVRAAPADATDRADLRDLPLVTIDDEDARDFDDAVWAAPAGDGGWRVVVAIADVAHYVRPGGALDREARRRGNSVYLPDRAVPMLPEALSNGLCSLRPGEERACLAAELRIDDNGAVLGCRFRRATMRSAARLTYREVSERGAADPELGNLFGAFAALLRARRARGVLDLDLPERRVLFDDAGEVRAIEPRPRFDSCRLIEEFMVAANAAAAEALVERGAPCLFRVHERPPLDRMERLRGVLAGLGYALSRGPRRPGAGLFDAVLARSRGRPESEAVALSVLRAQSQAEYSPRNIGHFGLGLARYVHFTSPIRRYADLIIHRALIDALALGGGGAPGEDLADTGAALSDCERRAAAAEREAVDRLAARFLADRVGEAFGARARAVTRFGVFVALDGSGAEGLIPLRSIPGRPRLDEARGRLVGAHGAIGLGAPLRVVLEEADTVRGMLRFSLESRGGSR